jgi:general secretion pathway protein D
LGGRATPNGTPSTGTSFQQRLNNIISGTSGGAAGGAGGGKDQIQLFGQTKIIPNESSSSLLIYATRADMDVIKGIIAKLDVPLAQVLVEAVIIDVTLGNTFNFGASVAQNPSALSPGGTILGGGGVNNSSSGNPFINFVQTVTSTKGSNGLVSSVSSAVSAVGSSGTNSAFANNLPGGASYFANIGPMWDVAVNAAETDSRASIIQRPRIQTSQAKPAQFFVGDTVPYVTASYGGYSGYSGNSYSQLSVGVELDVTPFINPEGMVSMDIQQEIDDLNGYTAITGVGNVPNTIKRTLNASITVRDRDTVMLGGFIKSDKSHSESGVPFLEDIPLLGNLFKQRADSKDRQELIVLMRPTVLQTPELASKHTIVEEQRLPAVSEAAAEDGAYERSLIDAQRKREQKQFKRSGNYEGFFQPVLEGSTNNPLQGPQVSRTNAPAKLDTGAEEAPVLPQAVHPQAGLAPAPNAPAATGAAAADNAPAPADNATAQQKAKEALMLQLNTTSPSTNVSH